MSYIVEDNVIRSAKQSGKIQAICQPLFDESPMDFREYSMMENLLTYQHLQSGCSCIMKIDFMRPV